MFDHIDIQYSTVQYSTLQYITSLSPSSAVAGAVMTSVRQEVVESPKRRAWNTMIDRKINPLD